MDEEVDEESISLSFQWLASDLAGLSALRGREADNRRADLGFRIALGLSYFGTVLVLWLLVPQIDTLVSVAIALLPNLGLIAWLHLMRRKARKTLKARSIDPRRVSWNHVTVNRGGVVWATDTTQEYVSWQGVEEICCSDRHGIWLRRGPMTGLYLPARVLVEEPGGVRAAIARVNRFRAARTEPLHMRMPSQGEEGDEPIVLN